MKDLRTNTIKRVAERFLVVFTWEPIGNKFNIGDNTSYKAETETLTFKGIVVRCINNYKGRWEYMVKDANINQIKRVHEASLELVRNPYDLNINKLGRNI